MTPEEVISLEGGEPDEISERPYLKEVYYHNRQVSKYTASRAYIFVNDAMIAVSHANFPANGAENLQYLRGSLTALYGEPDDLDTDTMTAFYCSLSDVPPEIVAVVLSFEHATEWRVNDDTRIWLYMLDGAIILMCFDASYDFNQND